MTQTNLTGIGKSVAMMEEISEPLVSQNTTLEFFNIIKPTKNRAHKSEYIQQSLQYIVAQKNIMKRANELAEIDRQSGDLKQSNLAEEFLKKPSPDSIYYLKAIEYLFKNFDYDKVEKKLETFLSQNMDKSEDSKILALKAKIRIAKAVQSGEYSSTQSEVLKDLALYERYRAVIFLENIIKRNPDFSEIFKEVKFEKDNEKIGNNNGLSRASYIPSERKIVFYRDTLDSVICANSLGVTIDSLFHEFTHYIQHKIVNFDDNMTQIDISKIQDLSGLFADFEISEGDNFGFQTNSIMEIFEYVRKNKKAFPLELQETVDNLIKKVNNNELVEFNNDILKRLIIFIKYGFYASLTQEKEARDGGKELAQSYLDSLISQVKNDDELKDFLNINKDKVNGKYNSVQKEFELYIDVYYHFVEILDGIEKLNGLDESQKMSLLQLKQVMVSKTHIQDKLKHYQRESKTITAEEFCTDIQNDSRFANLNHTMFRWQSTQIDYIFDILNNTLDFIKKETSPEKIKPLLHNLNNMMAFLCSPSPNYLNELAIPYLNELDENLSTYLESYYSSNKCSIEQDILEEFVKNNLYELLSTMDGTRGFIINDNERSDSVSNYHYPVEIQDESIKETLKNQAKDFCRFGYSDFLRNNPAYDFTKNNFILFIMKKNKNFIDKIFDADFSKKVETYGEETLISFFEGLREALFSPDAEEQISNIKDIMEFDESLEICEGIFSSNKFQNMHGQNRELIKQIKEVINEFGKEKDIKTKEKIDSIISILENYENSLNIESNQPQY